MQAELIVNYHCDLAEGPLWHPEEKVLYWTDIEVGRMYRYDPATGKPGLCYEGDKVGGMTLQADGSLLLFMNRGAVKVWRNGALDTVHEEIPEERNTRFNDVIADPVGRVLCGLLPPPDRGGHLYRLETDGTLHILQRDVQCSNGLAFTNGNRQLYYTDSARGEIYLFDYDAETGAMTNQRVFWKSPDPNSFPDGLTIDSDGCVWTAQWGGGCVIRLLPDGSESDRITVPGAKNVTSVVWAGDDFMDLYITTARQDDPDSPNAGAIFRARPRVRGVPEYRSRIRA